MQLRKESLKKSGLPGFEPWPLRYRCSALTNWANKPTGSWSLNWFVIYPGKMKMKLWIYTYFFIPQFNIRVSHKSKSLLVYYNKRNRHWNNQNSELSGQLATGAKRGKNATVAKRGKMCNAATGGKRVATRLRKGVCWFCLHHSLSLRECSITFLWFVTSGLTSFIGQLQKSLATAKPNKHKSKPALAIYH